MKPINIFALTRVMDNYSLQRLEYQMSGRDEFLKIKEWEVDCLRFLSEHLRKVDEGSCNFEYYYSFQIPKLGKEFDLLRISEDTVVNIELKSRAVADTAVKKQLELNRYYLSTLGRNIRSYTYLRGTEQLMRLTNGGRMIDATWEELFSDLSLQGECYRGDIEALFKTEKYLISPLTDPDRFLRRDYFLTSQQRDIKRHILGMTPGDGVAGSIFMNTGERPADEAVSSRSVDASVKSCLHFGFSGLPGTGKTLLLYDLAMELSEKQFVCVLHYGSYPKELQRLDRILKRVDFYNCSPEGRGFDSKALKARYCAVLVDEGHRMPAKEWDSVCEYAALAGIPVIVSYDSEDGLAEEECPKEGARYIEKTAGFLKYSLTNRIRMNVELSSFIQSVMHPNRNKFYRDYPSVSVVYANNISEAEIILAIYRCDGYIYISENGGTNDRDDEMDIRKATCRELDRVIVMLDDGFYYDERGYLRGRRTESGESDSCSRMSVRDVYHGLSRAKERLAILVLGNAEVFDVLLKILTPGDGVSGSFLET